MSDQALDIAPTPTRQQIAAIGRSAPGRVTGKLKAAIDAMIWQGLKRDDAAVAAGLQANSLYVALSRPHVKRYYLDQLEVLRSSERARNIHALLEVRDQTGNAMARVNAVKALEQQDSELPAASRGSVSSPGLTIQIVQVGGSAAIAAVPQDVTPKVLK